MATYYPIVWQGLGALPARQYVCGFCGASVAPDRGWQALVRGPNTPGGFIYVCHHCQGPTFIDTANRQVPGTPCGAPVEDITDQGIARLYDEARQAAAANAFTAAVLCCRKVLMHVAVEKGAKAGASFLSYVEHLAATGYIPPGAREWVDHIRTKSNEANHEILLMSRADAEELLSFTGMLLKVVYEFPGAMKKKLAPATPQGGNAI